MYRDVVQWSKIRHRILVKGDSSRQVARETGIDPNTIHKMLAHRHPQPYGPRSHRYPRLGPHVASIRRMLQKNAGLPPSARLSVKDIYERVRDEEGFLGGYSTVSDYVRPTASDEDCIWEQPYDLLILLEKKRVLDFLVLLSCADPPVISPARKKQFFHDVGRVIGINPKPNKRAALRSAAFEWMRSVLQKEISDDALRREIGDLPDLNRLLRRLYEGRLSDRNRSMVVLASRRGLSSRMICSFLDIDNKSCRKYLQRFERGDYTELFAPQINPTRKFDDEAIKKAIFGLLHEPPSNYGINRTTWIMADLSRVLRETGTTRLPRGDPEDHESSGIPLAQGSSRTNIERPRILQETRSHPLDPLRALSGRSVLLDRRIWCQRRFNSDPLFREFAEVKLIHPVGGASGVEREEGRPPRRSVEPLRDGCGQGACGRLATWQ